MVLTPFLGHGTFPARTEDQQCGRSQKRCREFFSSKPAKCYQRGSELLTQRHQVNRVGWDIF